MTEAKFYAAEVRALLACASDDDARPNLTAIHFAEDCQRVWATNGHVMAMRYVVGCDLYAHTNPRAVQRRAFDVAVAMCKPLDDMCIRYDDDGEPDQYQIERVVVELGEAIGMSVQDDHCAHVLTVEQTPLVASPPAWTVLPPWETIGKAAGRVMNAKYVAMLSQLDEAVVARTGHYGHWCIGFAPEATLPNGKKQTGHYGPLVARYERDGFGWVYEAMPLRPVGKFEKAWHRAVNGLPAEDEDDA